MILLLSLNKPVLPSHYHKKEKEDYPGGVVDESSPASAGDMGSILGPRRFHMPWEQLSPCAPTTETPCLEPVVHKERSHTVKNLHTSMNSSPCSPPLEKAQTKHRQPSVAKYNERKKIIQKKIKRRK